MRLAWVTLDKEDRVRKLADAAVNYMRRDASDVLWHRGGAVYLNDSILYCGPRPVRELAQRCGVEIDLAEPALSASGRKLFLCSYGDRQAYPLLKFIPEPASGELLDTFYMGDHVTVQAEGGAMAVRINGRTCSCGAAEEEVLVIWDRNGTKYFSKPGEPSWEVLLGSPYAPYIRAPEGMPLSRLYGEDFAAAILRAKEEDRAVWVCAEGREACVECLPAFGDSDERTVLIWDESSYLQRIVELRTAYDALYRNRAFQIHQNQISCEARLRGCSPQVLAVNRLLDKVCQKNITLILMGESGTGKTYLARKVHENSRRGNGPFIHVNCAAIPFNLIESELFGYEGGAFTGARRGGRAGYFELAKGGTLFLDEIAEVPLELQGKLLEVLQDGTFYRVGGVQKIRADVRLIVATNRDLKEMVGQGRFREDLYYRICVFPIRLPPLRERIDDLYSMVEDILPQICERFEVGPFMLTQEAFARLVAYSWPGNIRELENVLEKAAVMAEGSFIHAEDIQFERGQPLASRPSTLKEKLASYEKELLDEAYRQCGGDRRRMADVLGLSKTNLFDKIKKYGIGEDD